jgi:multidrug efflux pump subunit AcrB
VTALRRHADGVRDYLRRLPGVYDVRHDMDPGKLEIQYSLNSRGRELGLTQVQISNVIRTGYLGQEVVYVTNQDQRMPVRLIYADPVRHSSALGQLPIILATGKTVYLGDVADISIGRGLNTINRRDLQRLATVTAEVDAAVTTPLEVNALLDKQFADFAEQNPGYELLALGEKKEAGDSFKDMKRAAIISLAIIFFILSSLFRSLLDPLVVMFAIPFGLIGVVIGHAIFGYNLQFLSLIGLLALSGIVVNDSLILVDFAKRMRAEGMNRIDAMVEAGRVRVRPILLTSITTFLGISPLIFFATGQTAFLSPMAVSLGFGLLFATVLILVALPCFYMIADDFRTWVCAHFRRIFHKPENDDSGNQYCLLKEDDE